MIDDEFDFDDEEEDFDEAAAAFFFGYIVGMIVGASLIGLLWWLL